GSQCESDLCVGGPAGWFCTEDCGKQQDAGCPYAFDCKTFAEATGDGGHAISCGPSDRFCIFPLSICAVPQNLLCQTCTGNLDCGASGADHCLPTDGGQHFCGRDCSFRSCPQSYQCQAGQCVPVGKTCDCTADTLGMRKGCRDPNMFGACSG